VLPIASHPPIRRSRTASQIAPRQRVIQLGLTGISALLLTLAGCSSTKAPHASAAPSIEFTTVPFVGEDNSSKTSTISGRVIGAQPGQRIVLYARGQTAWWVQPFADNPFTVIGVHSRWTNSTHPGAEYAALLVGPDFQPPLTTNVLPTQGVFATAIAKGAYPIWQRWWFALVCLLAAAPIVYGVHRFRLHQMSKSLHHILEERLAERTRVAQELHDTLLQGVLSASMQLHVAVDQLPPDSPSLPALNRVLELMGQVVNEGRNTLRGLRSSTETAEDLKTSFSRIPQELGKHDDIEFRVVVEGQPLLLRSVIRDDVYSIGREALVNAFRHAHARSIDLQLEYAPTQLRILVRDDGCGIDAHVLESGRDGHWGLSGMRERAERIGARLKLMSRSGSGTEIELRVPGGIAFESASSPPASKGLARRRHPDESDRIPKTRAG
jgi:signal transduction histidine kinase